MLHILERVTDALAAAARDGAATVKAGVVSEREGVATRGVREKRERGRAYRRHPVQGHGRSGQYHGDCWRRPRLFNY
ncbi:hypothetical protein E2C01_053497 [Portunus trituberculatus]|uniref:Uncharacterized protein n=1 Tax=Portunus trituberculatus TaxID=210409 RepID=A0A5B7GQY2_PORTR|nr:hypothetical protein [Portunus trituberculatus]